MSEILFSETSSEEKDLIDDAIEAAMELHYQIEIAMIEEERLAQRRTRTYIWRNRGDANVRLINDYFAEHPTFNDTIFKWRFRMRKSLFMRIVDGVSGVSEFFEQRPNAAGILGFTAIQKITAVFRLLAYGTHPDALDESFRMSGRTARESLHEFCRCILLLYIKQYLRTPTAHDVQQLQAHHSNVHGLPGMLGSLDCMHWKWEMCKNHLKGQYTSDQKGYPTVVLEAAASQDLWFWLAYFGSPGSLNDVNILRMGPFLDNLINGAIPDSSFILGGQQFKFGYYLMDEIYPSDSVFVKPLTDPTTERRKRFKAAQSKGRKDIERAFGTLKKRFHVIRNASVFCEIETMQEIMFTCMILHNMILEDEGKSICEYDENEIVPETPPFEVGDPEYMQRSATVHNEHIHKELLGTLTNHVWLNNDIDLNMPPTAEVELAGQYSDHDPLA